MNRIIELIENKKVLFVTTKNLDYLRNQQELKIIKKHAENYKVIGSFSKNYLVRLIRIYIKLLSIYRGDFEVCFIGFLPQLVLPLYYWKLKKKVIIVDFFISLYDTMVFDRQKFRESGIMAKLCLFMDRFTIGRPNLIISDTKADAEYFSQVIGGDIKKITVLYLEADESIYFPRLANTKKNGFHVLYFGSILPLQGIDTILKAASILESHHNIHFEIIGPVSNKLKKQYGELRNTRFVPWLTQEELAQSIGNADLCLGGHFNGNIYKAKRTIAGKTYIYKAMKKNIILGENEANRELFDEKDGDIFFVEMGNPNALASCILGISKRGERE